MRTAQLPALQVVTRPRVQMVLLPALLVPLQEVQVETRLQLVPRVRARRAQQLVVQEARAAGAYSASPGKSTHKEEAFFVPFSL